MTQTPEYVVSFKVSQQISEDSWEVITPSLKVTGQTTVAEIDAFYRKYLKVGFLMVSLIQLQKPLT